MARRSRGFSPVRVATRRKTGWQEGFGGVTTQAISADGKTILGAGAQVVDDGFTLVRTRGVISIGLSASSTVGGGFTGAVGVGIVTNDAFAIGATAMPGPLADAQWDGWLFHTFFNSMGLKAGLATQDTVPQAVQHIVVDSKAMRKLNLNDPIFAMIDVIEIGVAVIQVRADSRLLLKLP